MADYAYELTFCVKDGGTRTFGASDECEDQGDLAEAVAFDIGRMFSVMNLPPSAAELVRATEENGFWATLAELAHCWDAEHNFGAAFKVTVDLDVLMAAAEDDEREAARRCAERAGFTVLPPRAVTVKPSTPS